jgi:hypothetical protein
VGGRVDGWISPWRWLFGCRALLRSSLFHHRSSIAYLISRSHFSIKSPSVQDSPPRASFLCSVHSLSSSIVCERTGRHALPILTKAVAASMPLSLKDVRTSLNGYPPFIRDSGFKVDDTFTLEHSMSRDQERSGDLSNREERKWKKRTRYKLLTSAAS